MTTALGGIFDGINQDKGMVYGLVNNAISYSQSKKSQKRSYYYARALQQQQYDLGIRGYKEAPSAQREGYETAGLNPMLLSNQSNSGVSVSGGTPVGANPVDSPNLVSNALDYQTIANQTAQTEATTDAAYADADLKKAQKASELERLPYVSKREKAEYQKTAMETAKLENDIHYQNEYVNYLNASLSNAREIAELQAAASRYGADKGFQGSVYNADSSRRASIYNTNRAHPYSSFGAKSWRFGSSSPRNSGSYSDPWKY